MTHSAIGYLPNETPRLGALVSLSVQQVITMFPATVLVALLTGLDVSVTIFLSGLATIVALLVSGRRIPMYYGSSFSTIAPIAAIMTLSGGNVGLVQVGVLGLAGVELAAGLVIMRAGKARLDRYLPAAVTGSVAIVIGLALSGTAMGMAFPTDPAANTAAWAGIAILTLVTAVILSVYLRGHGLMGMLPILLATGVGYAAAILAGLVNFAPVLDTFTKPIFTSGSWLSFPHFTFPDFGNPLALTALVAIAPVALATIPESTAHLYQMSLYIDDLAERMAKPPRRIAELIGLNLVCDAAADVVCGLGGAPAGTNYGENNSLMAITRVYSTGVIMLAGAIAMCLGFFNVLAELVKTIPTPVVGGLSIYLFGAIAVQGVAIMLSEKVSMFDPRNIGVIAVILVVGIGGSVLYPNGFIPVGSLSLPAIATSAVVGILLNLVFEAFKPNAA